MGRDPLGQFETRALLSPQPSQSAQAIVELFTHRWQVEVTFEETRAHLGIETQRHWNPKAIQRATPVLLGLFSIVTLIAHQLQQQAPGTLRPRPCAWYAKGRVSFSDALGGGARSPVETEFVPVGSRPDSPKQREKLAHHFADLLCHAP